MIELNETKYWLWLTMVFGVGSRRIWEAMCLFSSPQEAYHAIKSGSAELRLSAQEMKNAADSDISAAEQIIEHCENKGIALAGYSSPEYPPQLRHIADPPAVLYYRGNIGCLKGTRTVSAVGTRNASEYGIRVTREICRELACAGIVIVSGFALGTDITAQLAAADSGRPSACVLGCGIDIDYPRGNVQYREHILETGGVFVSEYPPGTPPHSQNFPFRNRILAALGRAAVVFEASVKSGSLITANLAADQGRELFCLPPYDIMSNACSGNSLLLRQGAIPLLGARDILDCFRIGGANDREIRQELNEAPAAVSSVTSAERQRLIREKMLGKLDMVSASEIKRAASEETSAESEAVDFAEKEAAAVRSTVRRELPELSGIRKDIAELMADGAVHADFIAQSLGSDAAELMVELTEMEIEGIIRSLPGKMFELY